MDNCKHRWHYQDIMLDLDDRKKKDYVFVCDKCGRYKLTKAIQKEVRE